MPVLVIQYVYAEEWNTERAQLARKKRYIYPFLSMPLLLVILLEVAVLEQKFGIVGADPDFHNNR
jgi:hypothetical protein